MVNSRCREKFNSAVYHLAVTEGDVRRRLRGAYNYLRVLREDEVPLQFRAKWLTIISELNQRGPLRGPNGDVYKSALDHTLDRMRNTSGRKIAERIYSLACQVEEVAAKCSRR